MFVHSLHGRYLPVRYASSASVKVGNMGTAISETKLMAKWAASKRTQVSACLHQTAPST